MTELERYANPTIADLLDDLRLYEGRNLMSAGERQAARRWVKSGHSIYEPCVSKYLPDREDQDFLDVYRQNKEIETAIRGMTPLEVEAYLKDYIGYREEAAEN